MLKHYITTLLYIVFCSTIVAAQSNTTFNRIATPKSSIEWMQIKQNERVSKIDFIQQVKEIFELNNETKLQTLKIQTDPEGWTHHRLKQTYKGVPIEDSEYILHEKNGVIHNANGKLIIDIDNISTTPVLNEAEALSILLQSINATEYAWQNDNMESILKYQQNDETATYYPTGKLCLVNSQEGKQIQQTTNYQLAYQFDVYATNPHDLHSYYIDAHTGDIIDEIPLICHAQGTASTNYYGNQSFTTELSGGVYRLHDYTRNIETYSANNEENLQLLNIVSTNNDAWTDSIQKTGSEAHWIAQETYDYFLNTHNLNGYNGFGGKLMIWVNYGLNEANAYGGSGEIRIGNGDGVNTGPLTTIDIVAHEYIHNIIQHSSDLKPRNESGALHESFADIFGIVMEKELQPDTFDWILGEDAFFNGSGFRSASDPNSYNDPNTYQGNYWQNGGNDNGGIHTNSGVQNHWFYLLSQGGSGTNNNGQTYDITGIGMDKAAKIAYRNMTVYLSRNSKYIEARNGSIQAAKDLYGDNSNEVQQVEAAWCAVGVGSCYISPTNTGILTLTSPNGGEVLQQGINHTINWSTAGNTGNSVTLEYSIDGGSTWQLITHNAPNNGSYAWTVPNFTTTIAMIQITANDNNTILDKSDAYFTIESCDVTALFSIDIDTICVDNAVTFTNESIGLINGFKWYINGTQISTSLNPSYTFTQAGIYTIELHALKGNTCVDIYQKNITVVTTNSNFSFNINYDNSQIQFFGLYEINATYNWTLDGTNVGSYSNFFYNYTEGGTYEVCLQVTNNCGSSTYCDDVTINIAGCTDANADNYNENANIDDNSCTNYPACSMLQADSLTLVALLNTYETHYNNNGYPFTPIWDFSQPVKTWDRVTLNSTGCNVIGLDMSNLFLEADIPAILGNLSALESLNLSQIYISNIPPELGNLTNLTYLNLSNNYLSNIPSELGNLTNLTYLNLSQTYISNIPPELGNLTNLTYLNLSQNYSLTSIPTELGNLTNLMVVDISNCQITGPIPTEFENLTQLEELNIAYNLLTGSIPTGLSNLNNLNYLDLRSNQLTGNIPTELENLTNLSYLNLSGNQLTGSIPAELSNLSNLSALHLTSNQLTGNIPTELGNLNNLSHLYLGNNQLTGNIPIELGNLNNLNNLNLYYNQLTGSIPIELGNLNNLNLLHLHANQLTGSIPYELENLNNLSSLHLSGNQLTGNIPIELGNLSNLSFLYLDDNQLTGNIPTELGNLSNLNSLYLGNNQLTGNIPAELGNLSKLFELNLSNNQLTGSIPSEWGNGLTSLLFLYLSDNQLTGAIPYELGELPSLEVLYLNDNQLSGCYPESLCGNSFIPDVNDLNGQYDFSNNPGLPGGGSFLEFADLCNGTVPPCQENPVYPGDLNFDGVADHKDILTYGLHFGEMGVARTQQGIDWSAQESTIWGKQQENGFDTKHIDGDGNGVIDIDDIQALISNYGNTHTESPLASLPTNITDSPIEIYLQPAVVPSFAGNDNIVEFDVMVSNTQGGGDISLYGTSFKISYFDDNGLIDSIDFKLNNSWLGNSNQDLQYVVYNNDVSQELEIGITRIDHANALGDGPIGKVTACINNITPWDSLTLAFDVEQIFASNSEAEFLPIATNYTELGIKPNEPCTNNLTIDPATDFQNTYEAANFIQTVGDVTIQNGQSVEIRSSESLLNANFEVKLGGDLYVTYDPCDLGNKPTTSTSNITKKVAKDIAYSRNNDKINFDYILKKDVNVSMEILTMDKQLIEHITVGQMLAGQQHLTVDRANLPTGQLWICLKQGRERYYFSIEN